MTELLNAIKWFTDTYGLGSIIAGGFAISMAISFLMTLRDR
jgi:hypothetical protein